MITLGVDWGDQRIVYLDDALSYLLGEKLRLRLPINRVIDG